MIHREPLSFYVGKIVRGEPFVSLLYGDGEFLVASGTRTGTEMAFGEVVTPQLEEEMRASLLAQGPPAILRGTDPHLIEPWTYGGRDIDEVTQIAKRAQRVIGDSVTDWYDGVVWDVASREGKLGPLLKAIKARGLVCLVANQRLANAVARFLNCPLSIILPEENAAASILDIKLQPTAGPWVHLLCCGLGAIPLAMRIRAANPEATVLDIGSAFDVFAGIGEQRGWRRELYADPVEHRRIIDLHLEGL